MPMPVGEQHDLVVAEQLEVHTEALAQRARPAVGHGGGAQRRMKPRSRADRPGPGRKLEGRFLGAAAGGTATASRAIRRRRTAHADAGTVRAGGQVIPRPGAAVLSARAHLLTRLSGPRRVSARKPCSNLTEEAISHLSTAKARQSGASALQAPSTASRSSSAGAALLEVGAGAELERQRRQPARREARGHDDLRLGRLGPEGADDLEAVDAGHGEVEQQHVGPGGPHALDRGRAVAGVAHHLDVAVLVSSCRQRTRSASTSSAMKTRQGII